MKNKITFVGANKVFFTFTALFLIFQFVIAVLVIIYGQDFINNNVYGILVVNQYGLILIPVVIYAVVNKLNFKEVFRLNSPGIIPVILIVIMSFFAYFVAVMLNTIVVYLIQFIGEVPSQPIPVPENLKELAIGILIIAVSPAICEELLHRGIMLSAYEKRGSIRALVFTSVLFGIFHFDIVNLLGPIFLGLLIGYYVLRTDSIFAGMIAHFMNNAIAEGIQFWHRKEITQNEVVRVSSEELLGTVVWGIGALIVLSLLFMLFRYVTRKKYAFKPAISSVKKDIVSIISHWPIIVILAIYLFVTGLYFISIVAAKLSAL